MAPYLYLLIGYISLLIISKATYRFYLKRTLPDVEEETFEDIATDSNNAIIAEISRRTA
tara:strand:- start:2937 stop:3113 length:177 start_codon:yes stop_codon:yes gene_type:complete